MAEKERVYESFRPAETATVLYETVNLQGKPVAGRLLSEFVNPQTRMIVIMGESGAGKSTLHSQLAFEGERFSEGQTTALKISLEAAILFASHHRNLGDRSRLEGRDLEAWWNKLSEEYFTQHINDSQAIDLSPQFERTVYIMETVSLPSSDRRNRGVSTLKNYLASEENRNSTFVLALVPHPLLQKRTREIRQMVWALTQVLGNDQELVDILNTRFNIHVVGHRYGYRGQHNLIHIMEQMAVPEQIESLDMGVFDVSRDWWRQLRKKYTDDGKKPPILPNPPFLSDLEKDQLYKTRLKTAFMQDYLKEELKLDEGRFEIAFNLPTSKPIYWDPDK